MNALVKNPVPAGPAPAPRTGIPPGYGPGGPLPTTSPWISYGTYIQYSGGLVVGNPASGNMGPGTINAGSFFVNGAPFDLGNYLPLTGGTVNGNLTVNGFLNATLDLNSLGRLQILRSMTYGSRPANGTQPYGTPYVDFAAKQFGVVDNAQIPQDLIGVTYFSQFSNYTAGQAVWNPTIPGVFVAQAAVTAGPWNPAQWAQVVTTAWAAPINSPAFTGTPTAPTPALGTNSTRIATTAYVDGTLGAAASTGSGPIARQNNASLNGTILYQATLNNTTMDVNGNNSGVGLYIFNYGGISFAGIGCNSAGGMICSSVNEFYWSNSQFGQIMHLVVPSGDLYILGALHQNSDERLKKNIKTLEPGLLDKLRPVTYNWKDEKKDTRTQYGFIAQEVQKVAPSLVGQDRDEGMLSLNYSGFIPELVAQIQALKKQVAELQATVNALKSG